MVPPASHRVSRVPWYSGSCSLPSSFAYAALTSFGGPSHALRLDVGNTVCSPQPRRYFYLRFGLFRFRSPLLTESRLISLPRPTYSDIRGSMPICGSPRLFAAYRVLLRLPVPRHSPCALCSLTMLLEAPRLTASCFPENLCCCYFG